ncbi:MAG: DUF3237 domain-containing protein [Alphaproteobacteria bacterium]|nr:DUF3237 domain-containing protein [Alphaproteobacteria bacterium]
MTLQPLPAPTLAYFCTLAVTASRPVTVGSVFGGTRRVIPIAGGTVSGPGLSGRVLGIGADWQTLFEHGVAELDARYAFELDDGAVIEIRDIGIRHATPDILAALTSGADLAPDAYYMRTAARLSTGDARYAWINRTLFVGRSAKRPDLVQIDLYAVG